MKARYPMDPSVLEFIKGHTLNHEVLAIFQVGSSARQYSLDNSDIDIMAFYRAAEPFRSFPNHTSLDKLRITIEHHEITTFIKENGDFKTNIGSLRQMHKVRDGVIIFGQPGSVRHLVEVAKISCLDPRVVLAYAAHICENMEQAKQQSADVQHQILIDWSELLSTLLLVSEPGRSAYSKPKWLIRSLRTSGMDVAADLICELYGEPGSRLRNGFDGVRLLYEKNLDSIDEPYKILLRTAINDADQIIAHRPEAAFPALRFTAIQLWRALHKQTPFDMLRAGQSIPNEIQISIGGPSPSDIAPLWGRFMAFFRAAAAEIHAKSSEKVASRIGTDRFVTHLLAAYDATFLFPYASELTVSKWISRVGAEI